MRLRNCLASLALLSVPLSGAAELLPQGLAGLSLGQSRAEAFERLHLDPKNVKCSPIGSTSPQTTMCSAFTPGLKIGRETVDAVVLGWRGERLVLVLFAAADVRGRGESPEEVSAGLRAGFPDLVLHEEKGHPGDHVFVARDKDSQLGFLWDGKDAAIAYSDDPSTPIFDAPENRAGPTPSSQ